MPRHNKTKKAKRKGSLLNKGVSSIKNTTKKVIPGLKTGLENIGSIVIKKTVPTAKNFFSMLKMKTKSKPNSKSKSKSKKSYKKK